MKRISAMILSVCMGVTLCACQSLLPEHQHAFATEWSKDETHHWHACTGEDCTDVSDKAEHNFDAGEITTTATKDENGVKTFTCQDCGQSKTEEYALDTEVTQAEWTAAFNALLNNNVTLTGQLKQNEVNPVEIKIDGDTSYLRMDFESGRSWEEYYVKNGDTYTQYSKNSASTVWNNKPVNYNYSGAMFLQMMPFAYSDFTYNATARCYEMGQKDCNSTLLGTLKYELVKIAFVDGKIVACGATMLEPFVIDGVENEGYYFEFTNYGTTEISLPTFE